VLDSDGDSEADHWEVEACRCAVLLAYNTDDRAHQEVWAVSTADLQAVAAGMGAEAVAMVSKAETASAAVHMDDTVM